MSESLEEVLNRGISLGLNVKLLSFKDVEISGPRTIGPIAAQLLSQKAELVDYLTIRHLAGDQHPPTSTLGRLSRNLLPYWRGLKIQTDEKPVHNLKGMCEQLYAAVKDAPAGEPGEELSAMILVFKGILGLHTFIDPPDPKMQWPSEECPPIKKGSDQDPNKNIKELPAPGLVRGDSPRNENKSLYGKA